MDEWEIAFYLEPQQLLLLLSLVDERPVAGVPEPAADTDWQAAALSLFREGRLHTEDGQLVADRALAPLLHAMKDAARVYAVCGRTPEPFQALFYLDPRPVRLDILPEKGQCRLCGTRAAALAETLSAALPPPVPASVSPQEAAVRACCARWEGLSPEEIARRWQDGEAVRCVLERRAPRAGQMRWLWVAEEPAGIALCQTQKGISACLDTEASRQTLFKGLQGEAQEDAAN